MGGKVVDVEAVIDSANYFKLPLAITIMVILIMMTDGFDLFTMGYVGPYLLRDWGLDRPELGPVNTAGLVGMAIGSVGMGWLGDRIGRKRAYIACLAFLFVGSLLCYYARGIPDLSACRFITGMGFGGLTPLAATLISEWVPKNIRAVVVACVIIAIPLGGAVAGAVARNVIPEYGWRVMFLIGAIVPLVLFVIIGWLLPESPKYLAQHAPLKPRLVATLNRLVGEKRFDGSETFVVPEQRQRSRNWFATIWNAHYRRTTALIWIVFAFNTFVLFVYANYLPTLLDYAGLDADSASKGLEMFTFGGALGAVGGAVLIGFFGSRLVGSGLALLGAAATSLLGLMLTASGVASFGLMTLCLLAGVAANSLQAFVYSVCAHAYSTDVRASAVGIAQTFSRIGGVASASAAPFYFSMQPTPTIDWFFFFMAACVLVVVVSFAAIPLQIPRNE